MLARALILTCSLLLVAPSCDSEGAQTPTSVDAVITEIVDTVGPGQDVSVSDGAPSSDAGDDNPADAAMVDIADAAPLNDTAPAAPDAGQPDASDDAELDAPTGNDDGSGSETTDIAGGDNPGNPPVDDVDVAVGNDGAATADDALDVVADLGVEDAGSEDVANTDVKDVANTDAAADVGSTDIGSETSPPQCNPDADPTCPGAPAPAWQLADFQPASPGFETSYGLEAFKGKVLVVALLSGW